MEFKKSRFRITISNQESEIQKMARDERGTREGRRKTAYTQEKRKVIPEGGPEGALE